MPEDLKKRICFVHLLNDYSGSPMVLSQTIKVAQGANFDTFLITGKNKEGFLSDICRNHLIIPYCRAKNKFKTLFFYLFSQVILFFKIIRLRKKISIIFVNTMLPFGAALAGKFCGIKVIYHIHETSIKPKLLKIFLRFIIKNSASEIIYVSESLMKQEGFDEIRSTVIYNSLSPRFRDLIIKNKDLSQAQDFNILMICSLKDYKGVKEFMIIAKLCQLKKDISFTLVLNAQIFEIKEYFKNFEVPPTVRIFPKQKDVTPFYHKASMVLNLSRPDQWVETFGLTILEALSFGIPVIVPPVGGPTEIIRDGEEGFLISSYEVSRIAEKINELSCEPCKYVTFSKKASARALDFNINNFQKKILTILNE